MLLSLFSCLCALQAPAHHLVVDRLLIGVHRGGRWHPVGNKNGQPGSKLFYQVGFGPGSSTFKADGLELDDVTRGVFLTSKQGDLPNGTLFNGKASWPRPVRLLSNSNSVYVGILSKFLKQRGVRAQARITKLCSVDLDGDGSQEILIEGSSRDNVHQEGMNGSRLGDYSVILLRSVKHGRVVTEELVFDHPRANEMIYRHTIRSVADFDGDGYMEFVLTSDYYEGGGSGLYRFTRGKAVKLVDAGAGV